MRAKKKLTFSSNSEISFNFYDEYLLCLLYAITKIKNKLIIILKQFIII